MWTLYSKQYDGIAIKTDFQALADSFKGDVPVHIGKVNYVDYDTTFIPESNAFSLYLHKRKGFEHEKEVRAIILEFPPKEVREVREESKGILDLPDICKVGKYFDIDIFILIHKIVVAPFAPDWFIELVQSVTDQYNLTVPVTKSSLATLPVWG